MNILLGDILLIFIQMPRGLPGGGGGWAVLELTGTLPRLFTVPYFSVRS